MRRFTAPLAQLEAVPGAQETTGHVLSHLPAWLRSNPTVAYNVPTGDASRITRQPAVDAFEQSKPGKRPHISLTPGPTLGLDDRNRQARARAIQVLVHEAVHAKQPPAVLANMPLREGMAEILSRKVVRNQYGARTPKDRSYQGYVNALHRRYGEDVAHVLRGMLIGGG